MASQNASRQRGGAAKNVGTSRGKNTGSSSAKSRARPYTAPGSKKDLDTEQRREEKHETKRAWENENPRWEKEKAEWEMEKAEWEKKMADLQSRLEVENEKTKTAETYWANEIKKLKDNNESECDKLRKENEELKQSLSGQKEDKKTLQDKYDQLEQDIHREFKKSKAEWENDFKKLIKKHTKEKEQLHKTINKLTDEKDSLLTRLSTLASDRLTHENVNIADLSDADRPTKLHEVYSELYDNEWTDAFEELIKHENITENDAIMILLKILMTSFQNCKEITWGRYERLKHVASNIEQEISLQSPKSAGKEREEMDDPSTIKAPEDEIATAKRKTSDKDKNVDNKQEQTSSKVNGNKKEMEHLKCTIELNFELTHDIKGIWRKTTLELKGIAAEPLYSLIEICLDLPFTVLPFTSKYLKRCIDLCWKMGFQEKPLHLDGFAEMDSYAGKKFDKEKFRAYTRSGSHIDFVVWPTLYLYDGGPILVKGIVQCCPPVEAKNEKPS